jgi:hypothetical protein
VSYSRKTTSHDIHFYAGPHNRLSTEKKKKKRKQESKGEFLFIPPQTASFPVFLSHIQSSAADQRQRVLDMIITTDTDMYFPILKLRA